MPPIRKKYSKNDKAGISRGKLVDKFRNALKFIRVLSAHLISLSDLICLNWRVIFNIN